MLDILARNWWAFALRGATAIVVAVISFLMPETALVALVLLFAAYLFLDGVLAVVAGVRAAEREERWGGLIVEGLIGIIGGAIVALFPGPVLISVVYIAGIWAIASGAALFVAALRAVRHGGEWGMLVASLVSLAWGVLMLTRPVVGVVVWAWWIGAYALVFGILMLAAAFRLRRARPDELA